MRRACLIMGMACGIALSPLTSAAEEEGAAAATPRVEGRAEAEKEKKASATEKREDEKKNQEPSCDN